MTRAYPFLQPLGAKLRAKVAGSPFDRGRSHCSHRTKQSARTCFSWGSGGPKDSIGGGPRATSVHIGSGAVCSQLATTSFGVWKL